MSESDPTGYRESPDTTDGPVAAGVERESAEGVADDTTLTTDDDAQREDSVMRPGNQPD